MRASVASALTTDGGSDGGDAGAVTPAACVVSLQQLTVGDGTQVQASVAAANLTLGSSVKVTGNAFVVANPTLGTQTTVTGTLAYGGSVTEGTGDSVGVLQHVRVANPTIATQSFTAGTTSLNVSAGATKILSPGAYGAVTIGTGAHVTFNPGVYAMAFLTVGSNASITISTGTGPVKLLVQGTVPGSVTAPTGVLTVGGPRSVLEGCVAGSLVTMSAGIRVQPPGGSLCASAADGPACDDGNACTHDRRRGDDVLS